MFVCLPMLSRVARVGVASGHGVAVPADAMEGLASSVRQTWIESQPHHCCPMTLAVCFTSRSPLAQSDKVEATGREPTGLASFAGKQEGKLCNLTWAGRQRDPTAGPCRPCPQAFGETQNMCHILPEIAAEPGIRGCRAVGRELAFQ